jgi:hypothetical protein
MEALSPELEMIILKLSKGVRFGLYDNGETCYFEDGKKVNYNELWAAIRIIKKLSPGHRKTLFDLYPDLFMGTFSYKFSKYRFARLFLVGIFGLNKQRALHGHLPRVPIP